MLARQPCCIATAGGDEWLCRGKRKGVYGSYLLAIYNEDSEQYETISKIGTGFSDEVLTELSSQLHGCIIPGPKPYYK